VTTAVLLHYYLERVANMSTKDTKKCCKCQLFKPIVEFNKNRTKIDGLSTECKPCSKIYKKNHYIIHCDEIKTKSAIWQSTNKEHRRVYMQGYMKERYNTDILYKLINNIRHRIKEAIKHGHGTKLNSSTELLGCTVEKCREHLESLFQEGMTWENHGNFGWHIDHIRPCASFDLRDPEQQKQCFHYTNLQPLWAEDNLRKSDKW